MNHTLYDLMLQLAQYCDGGLCIDDTGGPGGTNRVVLRINEAVERLMHKMGTDNTIQCVRMCVHNGCVTCGRDIRKILKGRMDGCFTHVFDKWYEFLENGPGMLEDDGGPYLDLIDRGMVPIQYDPPEPRRIMCFSDEPEATDASLLVRGFDETNREVRTNTPDGLIFGERIPITRDTGFYTRNNFSSITSVIKPVTNGYVYLSSVIADDWSDPTTFTRDHLASYHPDETRPWYRRYGFKTAAYTSGVDCDYRLNALVKMQFFPMSHSTDRSPINNMPAIKAMLQGMHAQDSGDLDKGQQYEAKAEQLLLEDAEDHETIEVIPEVQMSGWGIGDVATV